MKTKNLIAVMSFIGTALFLLSLMFGIVMPGKPEMSGVFLSDNWFHYPHPILAGFCILILVYILTPEKYIYFWRSWRKK